MNLKQFNGLTIILVLCSLTIFCNGYIQELILYESETEDGMYASFTSGVPNKSAYGDFDYVKRFCMKGFWAFFNETNYLHRALAVADAGDTWICRNESFSFHSFRHYGNSETELDGVSLLTRIYFEADEVYVEDDEYSGITVQIGSLSYSGRSNWTIFEGTNFDDRFDCMLGNTDGGLTSFHYLRYNVSNIGSLRKGC